MKENEKIKNERKAITRVNRTVKKTRKRSDNENSYDNDNSNAD